MPNAVKTMAMQAVRVEKPAQEATQAVRKTTQAVHAEDTTQAVLVVWVAQKQQELAQETKLGAKRTATLEVQTMSLRFRAEALGFRARSTRLALGVLGLQDLQALGPSAGGKALLVVP